MELNQNLSLKQEQKLSAQMLQSLSILTMPVLELKTYIQEQIASNPALEIPDYNNTSIPDDNNYDDNDYNENDYDTSSYESSSCEASDRHRQVIENALTEKESLSEHLLNQLGCTDVSEETSEIAKLLIGNLDPNGFYIVDLKTLFEKTKYSDSSIQKAVNLVQSFDPYGICCKDFRESLVVQAKCSGMADSDLKIFSSIVYEHLERLNSGKFKEVSNLLHISEEDLQTFYSILKGFTPHPGRTYSSDSDNFVIAELSVHNIDGNLVLDINRSEIPPLEISKEFLELSENIKGSDSKGASNYISSSLKLANNLISQVDMRYKTLYNAAQAIIEEQKDFFYNGPNYLKTLNLKDIATKIGVHETTVSRLSQSKWIETDWGTFQLKYFFSKGVKTEDGESISRDVVKSKIAELLSTNPKLSDQKISDLLLEQGIKCARRTVNKYRCKL